MRNCLFEMTTVLGIGFIIKQKWQKKESEKPQPKLKSKGKKTTKNKTKTRHCSIYVK